MLVSAAEVARVRNSNSKNTLLSVSGVWFLPWYDVSSAEFKCDFALSTVHTSLQNLKPQYFFGDFIDVTINNAMPMTSNK